MQALLVDADLLIFDEPFSALDDISRRSIICQLFSWLRNHKVALIMVTHSFEDAAYLSNRVAFWRHDERAAMWPQLYEPALINPFAPTGSLTDFSGGQFDDFKNQMFSEYLRENLCSA